MRNEQVAQGPAGFSLLFGIEVYDFGPPLSSIKRLLTANPNTFLLSAGLPLQKINS